MEARIGIDFGGVIVRNRRDVEHKDTSLGSSDGREVVQSDAYAAIRELVLTREGRVEHPAQPLEGMMISMKVAPQC